MMSDQRTQPETNEHDEFAREAEQDRVSFVAEFWDFLKHNKKWWLLPIVIALVAIGVLVVLGSTGIAPFIYTVY